MIETIRETRRSREQRYKPKEHGKSAARRYDEDRNFVGWRRRRLDEVFERFDWRHWQDDDADR